MRNLSRAQRRLIDTIRAHGEFAEYWPVVNDWLNYRGPAKALWLHNTNRTVAALLRQGIITIDDDGFFHLVEHA